MEIDKLGETFKAEADVLFAEGKEFNPTLVLFRNEKALVRIALRNYKDDDEADQKLAFTEAATLIFILEADMGSFIFQGSLSVPGKDIDENALSIITCNKMGASAIAFPYEVNDEGKFAGWLLDRSDVQQYDSFVVASMVAFFNFHTRVAHDIVMVKTLAKRGHIITDIKDAELVEVNSP